MTYLSSAWYRNGEDIEFYEPEFQDLASLIATGNHSFEREISNLGWHLIFTTTKYILKVNLEYDYASNRGSASIQIK
jgi:hypothetical protein